MGRLSMLAAIFSASTIYVLLMALVMIIALLFSWLGDSAHLLQNPAALSTPLLALIAIPTALLLVYVCMVYSRRLHDLNQSGWWLLIPIPLWAVSASASVMPSAAVHLISGMAGTLNILFTAYLVLAPGSKMSNTFGAVRHTPLFEKVLAGMLVVLCIGNALIEIGDQVLKPKVAQATRATISP
jgi:uncharacterized membrane protein YhaH (DUF805 family)